MILFGFIIILIHILINLFSTPLFTQILHFSSGFYKFHSICETLLLSQFWFGIPLIQVLHTSKTILVLQNLYFIKKLCKNYIDIILRKYVLRQLFKNIIKNYINLYRWCVCVCLCLSKL